MFTVAKESEVRVQSHLLTKERDSLILGKGNDVKQHVNRNAINILQSVAWEINEDIMNDLQDTLKPSDKPLTPLEERDRVNSFHMRDKETDNVINYLLDNGNRFFFGWKGDKRFRTYSMGYHINPQGNAYRKALLQFADKEALTDEGIKQLRYAIAETLGYDKATWFQRTVEATKVINDIFSDMRSYERKVREYALKADEPELFRKHINAWKRGVKEGLPIGVNIGADATASGIQIMSAMAGCPEGARNSNVNPKVERTLTEEAQEELDALELELASL